jgi:anti-sigma-K factor RskA
MNDATPPRPPIPAASWWRAATILCLLIMAIATATGVSMFEQFKAQVNQLQTKLKNSAHIKYITVLLDEQQAPALLITLDPRDKALQVQRLNNVIEGRQQSLQLWALDVNGKPRSLGVLGSTGKTLHLPVTDASMVKITHLAISVESKGGAEPGNGPILPYLFKGALVQKAM